jgi:putative nucleotidyltransferase with HDIG domain
LCWCHSVACAIIAQRVAGATSCDEESAYTAGILHDIGRIAMAVGVPSVYDRLIAQGANEPSDLLASERAFYGIDHCQAGSGLVRAWGLPQDFLAITAHHHQQDASATGVRAIVTSSCSLADSLGFGLVPYRAPRKYADVLRGFDQSARAALPAKSEQLASELMHEIRTIESA